MSNCGSLLETFSILVLKVPQPRKLLSLSGKPGWLVLLWCVKFLCTVGRNLSWYNSYVKQYEIF